MPTDRDLDSARTTLEEWLGSRGVDSAEVGALSAPEGVGLINETLFFDATLEGEPASLVLRVRPSTHTVMYEAQEFFEPQCRLMGILADTTEIPVPPIRFYEEDEKWLGAPFFVMDRVPGQTVPDIPPYWQAGWLKESTPEQQEAVWWRTIETIAAINNLDWGSLGLDFLDDPKRGATGFEQRYNFYEETYEWGRAGRESPTVEAAREWLAANRPDDEGPVTLSWGDARVGNLVYRDFEVVGVLDWEMASLGPALQDLGWLFFVHRALLGDAHTGDPDDPTGLPGFPAREKTAARWAELTGNSTDALEFFEVFAGFKLAINVQRTGVLFSAAGALPPDSKWPESNFATFALAQLIGYDHPEPEPMPGHVGAA